MRRVLVLAVLAIGARGEDVAPTPEAIQRAIDAGVAWLKSAQKEDGSFGPCFADRTYDGGPSSTAYPLGPTTFSLFTLAVCGVSKDDAAVQRGLKWFIEAERDNDRSTSYESSAVILMLCALNRAEAPKKLLRTAELRTRPEGSRFTGPEWMRLDERVQHLIGEESCFARGGFGYWDSEPGYADVSATQFAILALRAASFAGYPVEAVRPDVWSRTADFLRGLQDASGGFPYHAPFKPSRGMTAAALSTLIICREQIVLLGGKEPPSLAATIEKGLKYLDANFDVETNPSPHFEDHSHYHYCHLYAVERTGMLSGRREFGGKGWYGRGAAFLLKEQDEKGRWADPTCMKPEDILGTCFALLFLKKATIPAVTR
jgi:hypothetical protein